MSERGYDSESFSESEDGSSSEGELSEEIPIAKGSSLVNVVSNARGPKRKLVFCEESESDENAQYRSPEKDKGRGRKAGFSRSHEGSSQGSSEKKCHNNSLVLKEVQKE